MLLLSGFLIWWIVKLNRRGDAPVGALVGLTVITAGAIGNIIDCLFYGLIWDYAPFMFGKVVDMFFFPLITSGEKVIFFSPVFNFADSCVTCGAAYLLLFCAEGTRLSTFGTRQYPLAPASIRQLAAARQQLFSNSAATMTPRSLPFLLPLPDKAKLDPR